MHCKKRFCLATLVLGSIGLVGCMPKMTIEEMKAMKPKRPTELDRLNVLVGSWEGTSEFECEMLDPPQTLHGSGSSTIEWGLDKMMLFHRGEWEMEEMGKMQGLEIWRYDSNADKFRVHWFGSWGEVASGTAEWDDDDNEWEICAKGKTPDGYRTIGEGSFRIIDNDTIQWEWEEHAAFLCFKGPQIIEMHGLMKRK